jgi:hypothetical protein
MNQDILAFCRQAELRQDSLQLWGEIFENKDRMREYHSGPNLARRILLRLCRGLIKDLVQADVPRPTGRFARKQTPPPLYELGRGSWFAKPVAGPDS